MIKHGLLGKIPINLVGNKIKILISVSWSPLRDWDGLRSPRHLVLHNGSKGLVTFEAKT